MQSNDKVVTRQMTMSLDKHVTSQVNAIQVWLTVNLTSHQLVAYPLFIAPKSYASGLMECHIPGSYEKPCLETKPVR